MLARMVVASLKARRARLALSLLAVAVGVGVATALASLALRVGDDLARSLRAAGPNFVVQPRGARLAWDLGGTNATPPRAGLSLPEGSVAELKRSFWKNNVLAAAPELDLPVRIQNQPATATGSWYQHEVAGAGEPWSTGIAALHPSWTLAGRWPREDANELALGRDRAAEMDVHAGGRVTVDAGEGPASWLVTGVLDADGSAGRGVWTSLGRAQRAAGRAGEVDRVWLSALVRPAPPGPAPDAARDPKAYERYRCAAFPENVAHGLSEQIVGSEVQPMTERVAGEAAVVGRLNLLVVLLALAALTASALGVFSTTTTMVIERRAELGILRALGAGSGSIAALLLAETMIVAVGGGALGFGLGVAGAAAIRGEAFGGAIEAPVLMLPVAMLLAAAVAMAGTLGPLRLALRVDPARALRG